MIVEAYNYSYTPDTLLDTLTSTGGAVLFYIQNSSKSVATCKITCFCLLPLKPLLALFCRLLKATFHNPGFHLARLRI